MSKQQPNLEEVGTDELISELYNRSQALLVVQCFDIVQGNIKVTVKGHRLMLMGAAMKVANDLSEDTDSIVG